MDVIHESLKIEIKRTVCAQVFLTTGITEPATQLNLFSRY
jgi:hypothetical protein